MSGEGRTRGEEWDFQLGKAVGFKAGYRAGFDAGVEIGGAGLLLAIQHALPDGVLLDLLPNMPYVGEYQRLRRIREPDYGFCDRPDRCGSCSKCIGATAARSSMAVFGTPDYPGGPWPVPWDVDRVPARPPRSGAA